MAKPLQRRRVISSVSSQVAKDDNDALDDVDLPTMQQVKVQLSGADRFVDRDG